MPSVHLALPNFSNMAERNFLLNIFGNFVDTRKSWGAC